MSRVTVILASKAQREQASRWCLNAPVNTRIEFKEPKRTIPQNDRMWAMLTEIAKQRPYHGVKLTPDDLKLVFLSALKREVRLVPNIDGTGFVNLGQSSSDLSREEFSDLFEIIEAYCAREGIVLSHHEQADAA